MRTRPLSICRSLSAIFGLLLLAAAPTHLSGEATAAALTAFHSYAAGVEAQLDRQHRAQPTFLVGLSPQVEARLRRGEFMVERLTPPAGAAPPGALLHHWRGTAFARGATAADFERLMRDVNAYPRSFSPQVVQARTVMADGDRLEAWMRVRQRHVITVVMDATYAVQFGGLDAHHGYSVSRATQISEVDSPGTRAERRLSASEEHGFLWGLNTYWSWEERDGGLYMQIESISLTRSVPEGLGWVVGPYIESIPRESLEFTLRSACNALRR